MVMFMFALSGSRRASWSTAARAPSRNAYESKSKEPGGVEVAGRTIVEIRDVQSVGSGPIRSEYQMSPIRRPAWVLVAAATDHELEPRAIGPAQVDVESLAGARNERDEVSLRRRRG